MSTIITSDRLETKTIRDRLNNYGYIDGYKSVIPGTVFADQQVSLYVFGSPVPEGNIFAIFAKDLYEPANLDAPEAELPDPLYYSDRTANVLRRPYQTAEQVPSFPEGPILVIHLDSNGPLHDPIVFKYIRELPQMTGVISTRLKNFHNVLVPPPEVLATPKTYEEWVTWLTSLNHLPPWVKTPSTIRDLLRAIRSIVFNYRTQLRPGAGRHHTVSITGYVRREVRAYRTESCPFEIELHIPEETAAQGEDAIESYVNEYKEELDYDTVNRQCSLDNWDSCGSDWIDYDTDGYELEDDVEHSLSDIREVADAHEDLREDDDEDDDED